MRQQLLNGQEDIDWLFSTHLKHCKDLQDNCKSFEIHGNEDSPKRVALYSQKEPLISDKPIKEFSGICSNCVKTAPAQLGK